MNEEAAAHIGEEEQELSLVTESGTFATPRGSIRAQVLALTERMKRALPEGDSPEPQSGVWPRRRSS